MGDAHHNNQHAEIIEPVTKQRRKANGEILISGLAHTEKSYT